MSLKICDLLSKNTNNNINEHKKINLDQNVSKTQIKTLIRNSNRIQKEGEIERIKKRIDGFKYQNSRAWMVLSQRFGEKVTHDELVSVAEIIKPFSGIKLDRDARRRKNVIIKWFDDNWSIVEHYINYVILEDEKKKN